MTGRLAERAPTSRVQVVRDRAELAGYAGAIADLQDVIGAPASARWTATEVWLRHNPDAEPFAALVWSGGELAAGAVLALQPRLGRWTITVAGEDGEPARLPTRDPAAAAELGSALGRALRRLGRPWYLRLTGLPEQDPVAAALQACLPQAVQQPGPIAPRLEITAGASLGQHLSRNTRAAVAKARNRMLRDGRDLTVSWTREPAEIEACLPEIVDLHRRRNRQVRGRAHFDDPAAAAAFADLVNAHGKAGAVRLLTLRLDGELASFAVCLAGGGGLSVYANLVSPDWLRYSAGTVANAEVVQMGVADPAVGYIDWGGGIQRFKLSGPVSLVGSHQLHAWSSRTARLAWSVRHRRAR